MSLAHATRDNPTAAAHRIGSDDEALETARELAALFARESIQRDRERRLPLEELELFSRSGLWGIAVPREYGGAGVSRVTWRRWWRSSAPPTVPWGRFRRTISTPSKCCG